MRNLRLLWLGVLLAACSSELPHEAAFDTLSPLERQAKATIVGQVQLEGETDYSQVTVQLQNEQRTYSVDTDAIGDVKLTGIVPGKYALSVRTRYFEPVSETVTLTLGERFNLGTRTLPLRTAQVSGTAIFQSYENEAVVNEGGIEVVLRRSGSARTDTAGAPAIKSHAEETTQATEFEYSTVSSRTGDYSFDDVAAGTYDVYAVGEQDELEYGSLFVSGDEAVRVDDIVIQPLDGFIQIMGRLFDTEGGLTISSSLYSQAATVTANLFGSASATHYRLAVTDSMAACDAKSAPKRPHQSQHTETLISEGLKYFCAVFVDANGDETPVKYGSITFDVTPPSPVSYQPIASGGAVANDYVLINLSAVDSLSGVQGYRYGDSVQAVTAASVLPFVATVQLPLPEGDGTITKYFQVVDRAGNASPPQAVFIVKDTNAPDLNGTPISIRTFTGGLPLAAGGTTTQSRLVLASNVTDASALQIRVSLNGILEGLPWENYNPERIIDLPPTTALNGLTYQISAEVRDAVGHTVTLVTNFTVTLDTVGPSSPSIQIQDKTAGAVSDTTVTFALNASGSPVTAEIAFDAAFVTSLGYFPPSGMSSVTLPEGDGTKTLYVRFFDDAGNASAIAADSVLLDQTPPTGSFNILESSPTKNASITLSYTASGATTFRAIQSTTCEGSSTQYAYTSSGTLPMTLTGGEGAKDIYLQFFDAVGNASECYKKSIHYDNVAPVPAAIDSFLINGGMAATSSTSVQLSFDVAGATKVKFGELAAIGGADWQTYSAVKTLALSPANGEKTVRAIVSDDAGNEVTLVPDQSIILDTTPVETPHISAAYQVTTSTGIQLTLSAGIVSEMILSENADFSGASWEPYVTSKTFTLTDSDEPKTIYAKFKKSTGVQTERVSTTVILDRVAPILPSVRINNGATVVSSNIVTLNLSAVDETSGLATYKVNTANDFSLASPRTYQVNDIYDVGAGDGQKTVYVLFGDRAANYTTAPAAVTVTLDTTDPSITSSGITLLDGTAVANNETISASRVVLVSDVSDLTDLQMQVTLNGSYSGIAWEPYSQSKVVDLPISTMADGENRTIQSRVRDGAGRIVDLLTQTVRLDTKAPIGTVSLVSTSPTNDLTTILDLSANEASSQAQVSASADFGSATWIALPDAAYGFTLSAGDGTRTIYVRFRDAAGNVSDVKTISVAIDQTPPQLADFMITNGSPTKTRALTLDLSGIDIVEYRVAEDDCALGLWTAVPGNNSVGFALTGAEGMRTVSLGYRDAVGNEVAACINKTIDFDETLPAVTTFDLNGGDTWATERVVTATLNDLGVDSENVDMQLSESSSFSGAAWVPFTTSTSVVLGSAQGAHTVHARFRDMAGNLTTGFSDSIQLDSLSPVLNAVTGPTLTNSRDIALQFGASDANPMEMRVTESSSFAGAAWIAFATPTTFRLSAAQGSKTVYLQVRDAASNLSGVIQHAVTLDQSDPLLDSVTLLSGAYTNNQTVTLQVIADGAAEMMMSEDSNFGGASWVSYSPTKNFDVSAGDGAKTVHVKVRDGAGNESITPASVQLTLDQTLPVVDTVGLETTGGAPIYSGNVTNQSRIILASAITELNADTLQMRVSTTGGFAGVAWEAYDAARIIDLALPTSATGSLRQVAAEVRDGAGNAASLLGGLTFTLDTMGPTNPQITVNDQIAGMVSDTTITVTLSASDFPVAAEISHDAAFVTTEGLFSPTGTHSITLPSGDGAKPVYVRFFDGAGNASAVGSDSVTLDKTPPTGSFNIVEASPTKDTGITVSYTAAGATTFRLSQSVTCEGSPTQYAYTSSGTLPMTLTGSEGMKEIYLQFFDAVGNASECYKKSIYYDNVSPVPAVTDPFLINGGMAATSSTTVELTFDVAGATKVKFAELSLLGGADWQTYSAVKTLALSPGNGTKTIRAIVSDDAGNEVVLTPDQMITLDTTPPATPFISTTPAVTTSTSIQLSLSAGLVSDMILSENADFSGAFWEPYFTSKTFTLTDSDESKTIYAKFKKSTGVETSVVSTNVILDRVAPILPSVRVNNGATVVSSNIVTLNLSAVDETSGLSTYKVNSVDDFSAPSPRTYQVNDVYTMAVGDGLKEIWVVFGDRTKNYSASTSATVLLDTTPPAINAATAVRLLDDTALSTGQTIKEARVRIVSDLSDLTNLQMQISTNGSYTGIAWESYSADKLVDLPVPTGATPKPSSISVRVKDEAGHVVEILDSFVLNVDTRAPAGSVLRTSASPTNNPVVTLSLSSDETPSYAQVSTSPGFVGASWVSLPQLAYPYTLESGDGIRYLYVRFKDEAGNVSETKTASVTLDQTPPQLADFSITNGTPTNNRSLSVTLSGIDISHYRIAEDDCTVESYVSVPANKTAGFMLASVGDGVKTVSVSFRDAVGNETGCIEKTIELDETDPAVVSLIVNGAAEWTTERAVTIGLTDIGSDAAKVEMQLSEDSNFSGASWVPFTTSTSFLLSSGQGTKAVHGRFRDTAGNMVGPLSDGIKLDSAAPAFNSVTGPTVTNMQSVTLTLSATDTNAIEMRLSEKADFAGASWVPYTAAAPFSLSATEGTKTVHVQVNDAAGNASAVRSLNITLDKTAPVSGTVSINSGAVFTNEVAGQVSLSLSAADEISGLAGLQISNDGSFGSTVLPYVTQRTWTLDTLSDGPREVWVRFVDKAGNYSASVSDTIVLDRAGPSAPSIVLAGGAAYARSGIVDVALSASDANGVADVMLSTKSSFEGASWQPFTTATTFILPSVDGPQRVYAKFRDAAGNESSTDSDDLTLDTIAPQFDNMTAPSITGSLTVQLQLVATGDVVDMRLSEDSTFTAAAWTLYSGNPTFVMSAGEGTKTIYAQLQDAAGNRSVVRSVSVAYDSTAPAVPTIRIRQGDHVDAVTIDLDISAESGYQMLLSELADMSDASWVTFTTAKAFTLSSGDGTKSIYLKVRDQALNASDPVSATTSLDTAAPVMGAGAITINGGAATTNSTFVTLSFNVTGAYEMQISEDSGFGAISWTPYSGGLPYTLTALDGTKTVYARFRDEAGNVAGPTNDQILLDRTVPSSPHLEIAGSVTNAAAVTLTLSAADADEMKISMRPDFADASWESYATTKAFTLSSTDGTKKIYAKFRKSTSGFETASVSDTVLLDQTGPTDAAAEIASDVTSVTDTQISLRLSAVDAGAGLDTVEISESPIFFDKDTVSYKSLASYTLRFATEEFHPIYVRYKDKAGNYSGMVTLGVVYDVTPPTGTVEVAGGAERVNNQFVTLALTTDDAKKIKVYNDSGSPTEMTYSDSVIWAIRAIQDTPTTVNVIFVDEAGNGSTNYSDIVTYDTSSPTVSDFALDVTVSTTQLTLTWQTAPFAASSPVTGYTWYRQLNGAKSVGGHAAAGVTSVTVTSPVAGEDYAVSAWYADGLQSALSSPAEESGVSSRTKGLLLVDDDSNTSSVEDNLVAMLNLAGAAYDSVTVAAGNDGPAYSVMKDYQVVIWSSDEGITAPTLSAYDRDNLQAYLKDGGNLLFLGSDALEDSDTATFLQRWMHTGRVQLNLAEVERFYVPAGDLGGAAGFDFLVGPPMESVDAVYASALADSFLNTGKPIGIRYPQPGVTSAYRAAFMATPTVGLYERSVFSFNLITASIPEPTDPGVVTLALADDDAAMVTLPFEFRFGGLVTDTIWVGSNSVVGLKEAITTPPYPIFPTTDTETYPGALIAVNWIDLQPQKGGTIYYKSSATETVIVWDAVPVTAPTLTYPLFFTSAVRLNVDNSFEMITFDLGSDYDGNYDARFDTRFVDIGFSDENGEGFFSPTPTLQECCYTDDMALSAYFYEGTITESATLTDRLVRWLAAPSGVTKKLERYFTVNSTVSGADEMRVSIDGVMDGEGYQLYDPNLPVTGFPAGDGTRTVQVIFRDEAGNATSIHSDSAEVDTDAPRITNVVVTDPNSGSNAYAKNRTVTVQVHADATASDYMRISESGTFVDAGWVPYVESSTFTLSEGDGTKYLYAWLKDANGNVSPVGVGSIEIDVIAPSTKAVGPTHAWQAPININSSYQVGVSTDLYSALPNGSDTGTGTKFFHLVDLPFSFEYYGQSTSRISLWANGVITFEMPNPESDKPLPEEERVDPAEVFQVNPLAAVLYQKLSYTKPEHGVFTASGSDWVMVKWVAEDARTQSSIKAAIKLYSDGRIQFLYGDGNYDVDPIVGISRGDQANYMFASYDGQSVLSDATSLMFTPNANDDATVNLYYRYNYSSGPGSWVNAGVSTTNIFKAMSFYPPNGAGKYDFYTVGIDTAGNVEAAPATADLSVVFDDEAPLPPSALVAQADDDSVFVQWTPSLSPDVVAYRIYYGTDGTLSGSDASEGESPFDIPAGDHVRLTNLEPGVSNYVTITAIDQVGNESARPSGVSFLLPRAYRKIDSIPADGTVTHVEARSPVVYYRFDTATGGDIAASYSRHPFATEPPIVAGATGVRDLLLYNHWVFTGQDRYEVDDLYFFDAFQSQTTFYAGEWLYPLKSNKLATGYYGAGVTVEVFTMDMGMSQAQLSGDNGVGLIMEQNRGLSLAEDCCNGTTIYGLLFDFMILEQGKVLSLPYRPQSYDMAGGMLAFGTEWDGTSGGRVEVYDAANLNDITLASSVTAGTSYDFQPRMVRWVGDRLAVGQNNKLYFYNYGDVTSPVIESVINLAAKPNDIEVNGTAMYVANGSNVDVFELGELISSPALWGEASVSGMGVESIAVSGDYAYVADGSALLVYNVNAVDQAFSSTQHTHDAPLLVAKYEPFNASSMQISGQYLYAVYGQRISVVDISSPSDPLMIWTDTADQWRESLTISGTKLFTNSDVWDISNPRYPELLYDTNYEFERIRSSGDLLFAKISQDDAIHIFNTYDDRLEHITYFGPITSVRDFVLEGDVMYVYQSKEKAMWSDPDWDQLSVVDVSVVNAPEKVAQLQIPFPASDGGFRTDRIIAAKRGFVYMTEYDSVFGETSIVQVDLRNPREPVLALRLEAGTGGERLAPPVVVNNDNKVVVGASGGFKVLSITPNVPVRESFLPEANGAKHVAVGDRYVFYGAGNKVQKVERRGPGLVLQLVGSGEVSITKNRDSLQIFDPPGVPAASITTDATGRLNLKSPLYDTAAELCAALNATGRITCNRKVPASMPSKDLIDAFGMRIRSGEYPSLRAQRLISEVTLPAGAQITEMEYDRHRLFVSAAEVPNTAAAVEGLYVFDPIQMIYDYDDLGPISGVPTSALTFEVRDDWIFVGTDSTVAAYNWAGKFLSGTVPLSSGEPVRHLDLGHNAVVYTDRNSGGMHTVRMATLTWGPNITFDLVYDGGPPAEFSAGAQITGISLLHDKLTTGGGGESYYAVSMTDQIAIVGTSSGAVNLVGTIESGGDSMQSVNGKVILTNNDRVDIYDLTELPPDNVINRGLHVPGNIQDVAIFGDMMAIAADTGGGLIYRLK